MVRTAIRPKDADSRDLAATPDLARCAVVVVTHDGVPFIERCLRSLLQSGSPPSEIVVVDNASHDGTVDLVHRVHPEITVIPTGTNLGYGDGANLGIASTSHRYVAVLNQDVTVTPGWLAPLLEAMEGDPRVGLVTPRILLSSDPARLNACGDSAHYTGITTCRGYGRSSNAYASNETIGAVSGAAFVIRRDVFDAIGGFDPLFFMYLEETDLSLRAALAGYTIRSVPAATVIHDFAARFPAEKILWLERNRFMLLAKIFRWRTLIALLPPLALTELLVLSYAAIRGPTVLLAKVRAYIWIGSRMRSIGSARRRAQRLRRVSDRRLFESLSADLELSELSHPGARLAEAVANPFYRAWAALVRRLVTW